MSPLTFMSAQSTLPHVAPTCLRTAPFTLSLPGSKVPEACIATVEYLRTEETLAEMSSRIEAEVHASFEVPATESVPDAGEKWKGLQNLATWLRGAIVERTIAQTPCAERPFRVTVVGLPSKAAWTGFVEDLATADLLLKRFEEPGMHALEEALTPVLEKLLAATRISGEPLHRTGPLPHELDEGRFWFSETPFSREMFMKTRHTA